MSDETRTFRMDGAWELIQLYGDELNIEGRINILEKSVFSTEERGLVFDTAKTLIETVCKKILKARNEVFDEGDDLLPLVGQTLNCLRLLPPTRSSDSQLRESLVKMANGLKTAVQGLCELRNREGFLSHGHAEDGILEPLDFVQAQLAARTADSLIHFLFTIHKTYAESPNTSISKQEVQEIFYEDEGLSNVNEYIDSLFEEPIRIGELEYKVSEVLFKVDRQVYDELRKEFEGQ